MVKIDGHGIVLIKKETIDEGLKTMIGSPFIILHKTITEDNADDLRGGVCSTVYYNEDDGWYYTEGIIWDKTAQNLITGKGWSVSCSYDVLEADNEGGVENNIAYDKEFTKLNFTHLALVNNPRYERANIVFNAKDKDNFVEQFKDTFYQALAEVIVENSVNSNQEPDKWITIKGNHIPIFEGDTIEQAVSRFIKQKTHQVRDNGIITDTVKSIQKTYKESKCESIEPAYKYPQSISGVQKR